MVASSADSLPPQVVVLDYSELLAEKDLTAELEKAFCDGGLGIVAVRNVPGFLEARKKLLPLSLELARLTPEQLERYELAETHYCTGWSRGREKFKGQPDMMKGSFYANPLWDDPANGNEDDRAKYPYCAWRNIWPAEVPDLEAAFKAMGRIIYEASKPVVRQCDRLISAKLGQGQECLYQQTYADSRMCPARLLHYFAGHVESWCGWHNDNSVITGLVPGMWMNEETGEELVSLPKNSSGLHVQGRSGEVQRVSLPSDCLGLQIGEAAQILSGGLLRATPHFVAGLNSKQGETPICREAFAMFMQPQWNSFVGPPKGIGLQDILQDEETDLIPPLSKRLKLDPQTMKVEFGKLLGDSFQEYYKHNN